MNKVRLKQEMEQLHWYHSMDFGNSLVVQGRQLIFPDNYSLFGVQYFIEHMDLSGKTCLDIGAVDGLMSFIMKMRGVDRVISTDVLERRTYLLAREYLELETDYCTPVIINNLDTIIEEKSLDLVINAGVFYHLADPLSSLLQCRRFLKNGGYMILETSYLPHRKNAVMHFNLADISRRRINQTSITWRPSAGAVCGMLEASSFQVVAVAAVGSRLSVLAKAITPAETVTTHPLIRRLLRDGEYSGSYTEFSLLREFDGGEKSSLAYTGRRRMFRIDPYNFRTSLPLQPPPTTARNGMRKKWQSLKYRLMYGFRP